MRPDQKVLPGAIWTPPLMQGACGQVRDTILRDIRDREFYSRPRSLVSLGLDLRNLSFHKGQALRKPQDLLPG